MTESLETETLEHELEDLIHQLPITNSLSATEFINIDEDMVYDEETTAKEIVDTVRGLMRRRKVKNLVLRRCLS